MNRIFLSLALAFLIIFLGVTIIVSRVHSQLPDVKFRGTVVDAVYIESGEAKYFIKVDEVLFDPLGIFIIGSIATVIAPFNPSITIGDYVEVYAERITEYSTEAYVREPYHYIKKISLGLADLVVYSCGVSPPNPRQEDLVAFYAIIANVGGMDAYNFRLELWFSGGVEGWYLYDSGYLSLKAGENTQVSSDTPWRAEDGLYSYRWRVNPDGAIQESNYDNNECRGSFTVSPRTVTLTEYTTVTWTKTQTEKITMTTTITTYKGALTTETVTRTMTVTGEAVTITVTLTGLYTRTSYSPTITITVTTQGSAAQISRVPFFLSLLAFTGAIIYRRRKRNWKKEGV
jgi:hypothetical protein